jgi:hypothetical protein
VPSASQGVQAWDRYAYANNNPLKYNDPSGHFIWIAIGAAVGAALGYGVQVANNYNNGVTGTEMWTQNISADKIIGGALLGATVVTAVPAVAAMAGEALMGVGVAVGSANIFGAGMYAYAAAPGLQNVIMGIPDSAYVCRGGTCQASQFTNGSGVVVQPDGTLSDVSVTSAGGQSVETLSSVYPNKTIGVTTAGAVRQAGGSIVPSPNIPNSPYHATIDGLTGEQLQDLFITRSNPNLLQQ